MKPGQIALARMPLLPYSMAAAFVNAITPAFAAEYTLVGMREPFMPPMDDQLTIDAATGREHRADAVLRAEHDALEVDTHDPVVLVERDLGERLRAADAGDVEHGVDPAERLDGRREHGLDLGLVGHVDRERDARRHPAPRPSPPAARSRRRRGPVRPRARTPRPRPGPSRTRPR